MGDFLLPREGHDHVNGLCVVTSSADDTRRRIIQERGAISAPMEGGDAVHDAASTTGNGQEPGGSTSAQLTYDQPPPTEGQEIVWQFARETFIDVFDGQVSKGFEKYQTFLKTFNTRNAYIDALQEKADDLVYTTQLYLEATIMAELLQDAVSLMHRVTLAGPQEGLERGLVESLIACKEKSILCLARSGLTDSMHNPTPRSTETTS